jgi:hypothetical protein
MFSFRHMILYTSMLALIRILTKTPMRRLITYSFVFVLIWRALLEVTNQIISHTTKVIPYYPSWLKWVNVPANSQEYGLGHWAHWDGYHFLSIVLRGYHQVGPNGMPVETAFFPAFPVVVRVPSRILHIDPVIIGLFINFVLSVVVAVAVYKLALLMCERYLPTKLQGQLDKHHLARLSVLLVFVYPSSFFFASFYADALVAAGATLALYFALRERYLIAAASSFVVMSSKTTGLVLVPTLLMILLENEKIPLQLKAWRLLLSRSLLRRATVLISGIVIALAGYMTYLWHNFDDPMEFSRVESIWGRENSIFFLRRIFDNYYAQLIHPEHFGNTYQYITIVFVMALPVATIWLSIWYAHKFKTYWLPVMTVLTMILPLMSGLMESINRYTLILTPLAVALATLLVVSRTRKYAIWGILLLSAGLLFYFAGGFLNGNYFAG